jgi:hypothetical protein
MNPDPRTVTARPPKTFWKNLTDSKWVIDDDQFMTNQFLHPYGGTIYYGSARSAGLTFWESTLCAAAGSVLWETAGETTDPSINDQISTTFGGAFLGEPLFRMASLLLESAEGKPGFYGTYCYISPQIVRVSTAALNLGTTWQTWYSQTVALQGTFLGASAMEQPGASAAPVTATTIAVPVRRACSPSALFSETGPCSI